MGLVRQLLFSLLVLLSLTTPARADDVAELEKVRALYQAGSLSEAESRLRSLLDPKNPTLRDLAMIRRARMYLGAILVSRRQFEEAGAQFEKILLDDPEYEPDPLSFPGPVIDRFYDTKSKIRDRLNKAAADAARLAAQRREKEVELRRRQEEWLEKLKLQARDEVVVVRNSRWTALIPFGVGQFQNGQSLLGWLFLGSEAALLAGGAVTVPIFIDQRQQAYDALRVGDTFRANQFFDRSNTAQRINVGLYAALAGVTLIGIVQAQINYVPERIEHRVRALPPPPSANFSLMPSVSWVSDQGGSSPWIGAVGRF